MSNVKVQATGDTPDYNLLTASTTHFILHIPSELWILLQIILLFESQYITRANDSVLCPIAQGFKLR